MNFSRARGLSTALLLAATFGWAAEEQGPAISWVKGPGKAELGTWAEIAIPDGYMFTGKDGTQALMKGMGNLVSGGELGFLAPATVFEKGTKHRWFVVFEYDDSGHVKDDEKDSINADKLLGQLQEGNREGNKERKKEGLPELELTGWAVPPHYDEQTHNLEWGLLLKGESGHSSANYQVKLLGRTGVMEALWVGSPEDLNASLPDFRGLLKEYAFKSGQKYAEWRQGDKIAKYGLTALIAGGAVVGAAKLGLFKYFGKFFIFIFAGIAGAVRKVWNKLFGKKTELD